MIHGKWTYYRPWTSIDWPEHYSTGQDTIIKTNFWFVYGTFQPFTYQFLTRYEIVGTILIHTRGSGYITSHEQASIDLNNTAKNKILSIEPTFNSPMVHFNHLRINYAIVGQILIHTRGSGPLQAKNKKWLTWTIHHRTRYYHQNQLLIRLQYFSAINYAIVGPILIHTRGSEHITGHEQASINLNHTAQNKIL